MTQIVKVSPRLPVLKNGSFEPFDDLFNELTSNFFKDYDVVHSLNTKRTYPKVDVFKEGSDLVFNAAVPGIKKEQLNVSIDDGVLTIKGESQSKIEPEQNKKTLECCYIKELKSSSFTRRFTLPSDLHINSMDLVEAKLEDGVLEIKFKDVYKTETVEEKKSKEIPIQ